MPTFPRMSASRKPIWGRVMPDVKMAAAAATKSPKSASTSAAGTPVLSVENLEAWYGESHVLHGVNFNVNAGEVVTLLGRNGVAFCPEERGIFASLDVRENLLLPPVVRSGGLSLDQIFNLFPNLKERLNSQGTKLSGGEQQMLAIARILRTGARFLMLDEPTEGLAPVIIQQIGYTIARLKSEGFTILLVEQNFRFASTVADRFYIVEHGKIIDGFANSELQANMDKLHTYLGV